MEQAMKRRRATYHIWTFTASKLISAFGAQVYTFAVSFYILQLTGSAASFAMNLICSILPRTIAAPFAGYAADRWPKKTIVLTAQGAIVLAVGGLLSISLIYGLSLPAIYVTTALISLAASFSGVSFSAAITGLVDEARIQKAMSLNQMSISIAAIGAPAVGGLLYGTVSMNLFLILFMAAETVALILEATMNFRLFNRKADTGEATGEGPVKEPLLQSMKAGITYLKTQPIILSIIWISLFINFLFGAFQVGYSYILIEKMKVASEHFGMTEGAFAVGMLLMSIGLSVRKEVKYPLLVSKWGIVTMGLIMASVALPVLVSLPYKGLVIFYASVMFAFGMVMILVNTPIQVMMQKGVDDDYKGRVFAILETMAMALMPLGTVLYGFLYDLLPAEWILIVSAAVLIAVVLTLARPSVVRKAHPELAGRHPKGPENPAPAAK
ncbi:MFS transporter [Bhargavaea beijingensis]|uniref:MFS transporter n=2 Tax=Bhargavaea beijingensis TaxID=426756 RepID=A0ABX9ZDC9_9BACL|nr:MFS transporter [Bhargavaea beijingensis]MCW1927682.1 MFS transporter [Bhargavaea beijingensis]RSK33342.1 MFS transporter [Bhargavaea beijingensis]